MIRLFVGLPVPENIAQRLSGLSAGVPGVRWIAPSNMHITLRFIGEVAMDVAGDLDAALAEVRQMPFDAALNGIGHFGDRRQVRAIWAGVEETAALRDLKGAVDRAARYSGAGGEDRKFRPHVTIGRCRGVPPARIGDYLEQVNPFAAGPFTVDRFVLYSSHLGKAGADYTEEADYPLDG